MLLAVCIVALALAFDVWSPDVESSEASDREMAIEAALTQNRALSAHRTIAAGQAASGNGRSDAQSVQERSRDEFTLFRRVATTGQEVAEKAPAHRWLDPSVAVGEISAAATANGRGWVFGWIQIRSGSERDRLREEWASHGVRVLDFSGTYARVRLPGSTRALESMAAQPAILGMGLRPAQDKFAETLLDLAPGSEIPVLIGLMDDDADGRWRGELEARGAVVGDWLAHARAYAANVHSDRVMAIAEADFVSQISPVSAARTLLDTAVAVMGADHLRTYNAATRTFAGRLGGAVSVGLADSGLNIAHVDIAANRSSICGQNFYPDADGFEDLDLWADHHGHGTHVTGIVAGAGMARPEFAGMAPGVGHLRIAKVVNRGGAGSDLTIINGVRYLLGASSCEWNGDPSPPVRPLVLNFSVGSCCGARDGLEIANRYLDSAVWQTGQLLVFAAGNEGSDGTSDQSTSKNVLSVGAITDAGIVTSFSSHGPTGDGRLAPHVVGTGSVLLSARGTGSADTYIAASGTSMSAPSVVGVAALLMDQDRTFRGRPAYAKARLMASAVKPAAVLDSSEFPLSNTSGPGVFNEEYGLGLVSAGVAVVNGPEQAWRHGGDHGTLAAGETFEYDIEVPEDTARLDVALAWHEPPAEPLAESTVVADLDLYVDKDGDCAEVACGEHASTSRVDNVEWVVLRSPEAGSYTVRMVAANDFADPVRAGIAWTAIKGSDTPTLTLSAKRSRVDVEFETGFELDLEVTADNYVAGGTTLQLRCKSREALMCTSYKQVRWRPGSEVVRQDGTAIDIGAWATDAIPLGEVQAGERQRIRLVAPKLVATSSHTLYFVLSAWNAPSEAIAVDIVVDSKALPERVVRPANDAATDAIALEGESGELTVDLVLATREPGEPMRRGDSGVKKFFAGASSSEHGYDGEMQAYARHASLWYSIEPDRDGPYTLTIPDDPYDVWITLYKGDVATDATRISEAQRYLAFIAEEGEQYLLQIWSTSEQDMPLSLQWDQHQNLPPANDDFDDRTTLTGASGTVQGSNYKASLEEFEYYGVRVSGSTWYRWIAPSSGRFLIDFPRELALVVLSGTDTSSLRRVSSMPNSGESDAEFLALQGREYQFVVLDSVDVPIFEYEFSWQALTGSSYGPDNDLLSDAAVISGDAGSASVRSHRATVEPDEDVRTGVGTTWWRWESPRTGRYLFRLGNKQFEQVAVFVGESSDRMEFVDSGRSVLLDAAAENQYWISVGHRLGAMFVDFDQDILDNQLAWGPVPANDMLPGAKVLSGSTGTVTGEHTYATSSVTEPGGTRGHSSLWWSWRAPKTGWQRFALEGWESAGLEDANMQSLLEVYRSDGGSSYELLASSDHSYVISGRAEAIVRATSRETYLVRVALRSTELGDWSRRTAFTYQSVDAPAWQRYMGRTVQARWFDEDQQDDMLEEPRNVAIHGETGLIVVAARDQILVYSEAADGGLSREFVVPYESQSGQKIPRSHGESALYWDAHASLLYLINPGEIFAVRGLNGGKRYLESCWASTTDHIYSEQIASDSKGEHLYVIGNGMVGVYDIVAPCEFERVQILHHEYAYVVSDNATGIDNIEGANSLLVGPTGDRVYVAGSSALLVLARDADGTLSPVETVSYQTSLKSEYWGWGSTLALGGEGEDVLFLVGPSPLVAAFRIRGASNGSDAEVVLLSEIEDFYLESGAATFFSQVASPVRQWGCAATAADGASGPAVAVFCPDQALVAQWEEDAAELYMSDWFQTGQPDRFGGALRSAIGHISPRRVAKHPESGRNYVVSGHSIGIMQVFEPASRITSDPYAE